MLILGQRTQKKCYAINIPTLRTIAKEIKKGNYLSFIKFCNSCPIELNLIKGILICSINDISKLKECLLDYGKDSDSWVETDIIKLKINKNNEQEILKTAKEYLKCEHVFVRRLGIILLFNFINETHIDDIFVEINNLYLEKEYYVIMAISWLLCECYIKQKEKTIIFLEKNKINAIVFKKFLSKCNDSFRILEQDKFFLKTLIN